MSASRDTYLWLAQRISAMILGIFVLAHLITILYVMRDNLSAADILSRTQGNVALMLFYGLFVLAVSVHAPIGLRAVFAEWFGLAGKAVDWSLLVLALVLAAWGFRAVWGVFVA